MGPRVWGIGRDRTGFFAERDDLRRSETRKTGAEKQGVVEEGSRGEKNNCRRTRLRGLQPRTPARSSHVLKPTAGFQSHPDSESSFRGLCV